jgi:hypothetical protein
VSACVNASGTEQGEQAEDVLEMIYTHGLKVSGTQ